ncbi:MAG: acyl--CoA ligase [Oligoflexia bacterium]|nr:acyl--CoA ligase [Oligoflexia bacterium]
MNRDFLYPESYRIEELQSLWNKAVKENRTLALIPKEKPEIQKAYRHSLNTANLKDTNLVVFSSGSTGEPKAIVHSLDSIRSNQKNIENNLTEIQTVCCLLPPWSMAGFQFHLAFLESKFVIIPFQENIISNIALCEKYNRPDTLLVLNPFILSALSNLLSTEWRGSILSLTAPILPKEEKKYLEQYQNRFILGYGLSEAAGPVLFNGKSIGHHLSLSSVGELIIESASLCQEIHTAGEIFYPKGKLFTGDLFSLSDKKYLFQSREKDLIDLEGKKIPPTIIESILFESGYISDGIAYKNDSNNIQFDYVAKEKVKQEDLVLYALKNLSTEYQPKLYKEVEQIERLANGKLNRKKFRN